jgi:hypothetical protein
LGEVSRERLSEFLAVLERGWVENAGQRERGTEFAAPEYFGTTWVGWQGE